MIGFIGGGKMAEALIKGITGQGNRNIVVSEPLEERRHYLETSYRIKTSASNKEVADTCSIIILAVKPQNMSAVLDEITSSITEDKTVVSIAAGITLAFLQKKLKTKKLVRVMPNTPAIVQEGMSVLSLCECFSERDIAAVREIFMSVGKVLTLPEKYMNAVTALSGSGPAFIALFTEALIAAGVRMGLAAEHSSELALQTLEGTAKLLETGMSPEQLRIMVTSPGGTTAAGLKAFEEKGFINIVADALDAALKRAEELGSIN
ncbi:MAG: pyrroline-5-carboxylate reductase [Dissulfurispiraceae bacterium]|jgi:pyrroline-5-carboxylate reductase